MISEGLHTYHTYSTYTQLPGELPQKNKESKQLSLFGFVRAIFKGNTSAESCCCWPSSAMHFQNHSFIHSFISHIDKSDDTQWLPLRPASPPSSCVSCTKNDNQSKTNSNTFVCMYIMCMYVCMYSYGQNFRKYVFWMLLIIVIKKDMFIDMLLK